MATDQDKVIDAAISTLIDHAEGSYRGDLGDIEQEIDDYLAALRRDRETLRKVMDVVERRGDYSDFNFKSNARSRFEEIERLVREEKASVMPIKYRRGLIDVASIVEGTCMTGIEISELRRLQNEAAFAELVCEMAHRVNGEHLATDDVIRATGVELRDMVRSLEDGHRFAAELAELRRKGAFADEVIRLDNLNMNYAPFAYAVRERIANLVREQEQEKGDG